jgi:hypothetical protein
MDLATNSPFKKTWCIVVIDPHQYKESYMFATKGTMVKAVASRLDTMKETGKHPAYLQMDMTGENKMLATRLASADWKLNDTMVEFTSRDTPQQNSLAEVALRTLASRARAMTVAANVPPEHKKFTVAAIQHATVLDNLVPVEIDAITKSR